MEAKKKHPTTLARQRMKLENPVKYQEYLDKQKARREARKAKEASEPMTRAREAALEEQREKKRLSNAIYKHKKRLEKKGLTTRSTPMRLPEKKEPTKVQLATGKMPKDMTRDELLQHRAEIKKRSRANESAQKKRRVREKARLAMRQRRLNSRNETVPLRSTPQYPSEPPSAQPIPLSPALPPVPFLSSTPSEPPVPASTPLGPPASPASHPPSTPRRPRPAPSPGCSHPSSPLQTLFAPSPHPLSNTRQPPLPDSSPCHSLPSTPLQPPAPCQACLPATPHPPALSPSQPHLRASSPQPAPSCSLDARQSSGGSYAAVAKKTLYNIKYEMKKLLRKASPGDSAALLESLADPRSPEYKAAIAERGFIRSPEGRAKARRKLETQFGGPVKTVRAKPTFRKKCVLRARKTTKFSKLKQDIKDFYVRYAVSRPLPHKRYNTKAGPAHVMNITLRGGWKLFKAEFPQRPVSYSLFCSLRPRNVRKLGSVAVETCLCIYCLNVKYMLDCLNRALSVNGQQHLLPPENKLLSLICCPFDSSAQPRANCIFGQCNDCQDSVRNIRPLLEPIMDCNVSWTHWGRSVLSKKVDVFTSSGTVRKLLEALTRSIDAMTKTATFREHIFTAHWQYKAAKDLKFGLLEHEVLMIMDFAENRKACFNAEVKSAHFGKSQITLHPIVAYFKNAQGQLLRHSLMYLSDDIKHDYHAVHHYTQHAIEYVKGLTHLRRVYLFSDGCASQYKGRGTLTDLSLTQGVQIQRCYYGSEHGKGEADGETGVLSQMLSRAVLGGGLNVRGAEDLYNWAAAAMGMEEEFKARKFFLVGSNDIRRDRPETCVATVSGTRSFHQVERVEDYVIRCRRLACFCLACRMDQPAMCVLKAYVGSWETFNLRRTSQTVADVPDGEVHDGAERADEEIDETEESTPLVEMELPQHTVDKASSGLCATSLPVGSYIEVEQTSTRGTKQTDRYMIVESDLPKGQDDVAVQWLKFNAKGKYYTLHSKRTYILDSREVKITPLPVPSINSRMHLFF